MAAHVRSLPRFDQVQAQWVVQGMEGSVAVAMEEAAAVEWNSRGVDITGPGGQNYHYEILSGTESNFALHGRRMASTFFRMIFF